MAHHVLTKKAGEWAENDLQSLLSDKEAEQRLIEYKSILPGSSDGERREFLADASSFANSAGGYIVYGMEADKGVPTALVGLEGSSPDSEKLRLENMLRSGLSPRVPGLHVVAVPLHTGRYALILHMPRSWAAPHRVIFGDHGHFYARNSAGKYRLDVGELRAAFLLAENAATRISDFRRERVAHIAAGDTAAGPLEGAAVVLHLVSFGAPAAQERYDVAQLRDGSRWEETRPIDASGYRVSRRLTFDGFLHAFRTQ